MKAELHLEVILTHVFERDSELLEALHIADSQGDQLLRHGCVKGRRDRLVADEFGDLDLACEKNLHALSLRRLPSVFQEVFHAATELRFQELFKALRNAELLVTVREQTDVDDRQQVLSLRHARGPHHNYEVLLSLRT